MIVTSGFGEEERLPISPPLVLTACSDPSKMIEWLLLASFLHVLVRPHITALCWCLQCSLTVTSTRRRTVTPLVAGGTPAVELTVLPSHVDGG